MRRIGFVLLFLTTLWADPQAEAQKWVQVGVLITDASRDESMLWIEVLQPITVDRTILLESRDGTLRRQYEVAHLFDGHLVLKKRLDESFLAGSRLYQ